MTISWLRVLSVSQSIIGNTYAKKALQFDFDEFEHADLHAKHVTWTTPKDHWQCLRSFAHITKSLLMVTRYENSDARWI